MVVCRFIQTVTRALIQRLIWSLSVSDISDWSLKPAGDPIASARFNRDSRQLTGVGGGVWEGSGGMSLHTDGRALIPGNLLMTQPAWREGEDHVMFADAWLF